MNGKKSKEIRRLARDLHLSALLEEKMMFPENSGQYEHQRRYVEQALKKNYKTVSKRHGHSSASASLTSLRSQGPEGTT